MRMVMLQVLGLVLKASVFACFLVIHGFAVPLVNEGMPGHLSNANVLISIALSAVPQSNGTGFQPPLMSERVPQTTKGLPSSPQPSPASAPPPYHFVPVPPSIQNSIPAIAPISPTNPKHPEYPPLMPHAPVPSTLPSSSSPSEPVSMPPKSHQTTAPENKSPHLPIAPASNVLAPRSMSQSSPPSHSVFPEESPSFPPVPKASSPPVLPSNPPPMKPLLPEEPLSSPTEQNPFVMLTPPPMLASMPVAAPANKSANRYAPVSHSPTEVPSASKPLGHSNRAPSPHPFSKSNPGSYSPTEHHHPIDYKISPAPLSHIIPPASSEQAPRSDPKAKLRQNARPPTRAGSSLSPSPSQILPPISSADNHYSPAPTSSPKSPSKQAKIFVSPIISPSGSTTRNPKMPPLPPLRELPPPPPHRDCVPLTCTEPLTYGPPESPCICVLPIQVGLSLTVALYTFFPLVSQLAEEIASGVFMKQSQVRIMGANADGDNPQKTIVLIDLVPLRENFDDNMAYLTFQRFWYKQVVINTSFFGDYDVLYVRYPGLPPSPPLPPSTNGITGSTPYPGHDNNARTIQPLGVDIKQNQHKDGVRGSILVSIIVSASVIVILLCSIAWVFLSKYRDGGYQLDPTPPTTFCSLTKLSGMAVSMVGSGPSSPSFSLGSSIATYTVSAKTFSSSDIERATDHFNETRILGEGGFGVVYSGVLEDGTKVAMKILKRYDQQGGREFLAEVEMLSRLHHRNLVKLIGICIEHRTRCLVYELIPNGSVESHLHGIDKETAPLDWSSRLKIALGAARALAYLHEDSSPRVIHRDFKASNILLEDDYTPKVSDFGLARTALEEENRHISTRVMGTFGYVAPEYAMTGHLLVKSDVYSYGVVLLELLTGKKPIDMSQPPGQENLVSWARPLLTSREGLESIIDPSLGPNFPFDSIAKVGAIASMCVQPEVSHRPFMGEVVQALKLVYNECNEIKELQEDLSTDMEARKSTNSGRLPDPLLTQSPVSDYDYRLDVEKDLSMSELLSSTKFDREDSESFRRNSSSGPLRTGKSKQLWKIMRRLSGGSVSEHGVIFRLWPGSH